MAVVAAGAAWAQGVDARLAAAVGAAYGAAPAVRQLLDGAGVDPAAVQGVADLEAVPVTTKDDLVRLQAADPPFGGFCTRSLAELSRVFVSPGPLYEPGGEGSEFAPVWLHEILEAFGVPRQGVALNTFAYHLVPAGLGLERTLRDYGLAVVPGGVGNRDIQARAARDLGVLVYCGTPSFLLALLERAEELGWVVGRELSLRYAVVGAEAFPAALRGEVTARGITPIQTYGTAEVGIIGCECPAGDGFHLSGDMAVEILDPASGRSLPAGQPGQVVVTSFNEIYPLVRFGTGDVASLRPEPCPCGRPSPLLSRLVGRVGAAVKVRGMFLHPGEVDDALGDLEGVARYQVSVRRPAHRDEVVVRLEPADGTGIADPDVVASRLRGRWRIRADRVEIVPSGTLGPDGPALVDERSWEG